MLQQLKALWECFAMEMSQRLHMVHCFYPVFESNSELNLMIQESFVFSIAQWEMQKVIFENSLFLHFEYSRLGYFAPFCSSPHKRN